MVRGTIPLPGTPERVCDDGRIAPGAQADRMAERRHRIPTLPVPRNTAPRGRRKQYSLHRRRLADFYPITGMQPQRHCVQDQNTGRGE